MQLIDKIRFVGNQYFLTKALVGTTPANHTLNFAAAKSIGILFDASKVENISAIKEYAQHLKSLGKNVELYGLYKDKKQVQDNVFDHFTMADVNWLHVPREGIINSFGVKPFDLLLSLHNETVLPLEYISALSKAKCRVGRYIKDKTYCYDLMAAIPEGADLKQLILQIDQLIKEINKDATV